MRFSRMLLPVLPAAAVGLYAQAAFLSPGFGQIGDQAIHLELAEAFSRALADGDFPPAWSATANGGLGSPAFVFYPPMFFATVAAWMPFTDSAVEALRLAYLSCVLAAFWAVYYLARAWLSPVRSSVAAAVTLALPATTFVGWALGLLPAVLAFAWTALLFGGLERAVRDGRAGDFAVVSLAGAGLILTHQLTAYMTAWMLLAWLVAARGRVRRHWRRLALATLGAAALTAWFWIPLFELAPHAQGEYLTSAHPYDASLWFSPERGVGESRGGWDGLHWIGHAIVAAQLVLASSIVLALRGEERPLFLRALPWVVGLALAAALWPFGSWLAMVPYFELIQFSWRWQVFVALWCAAGLASLPKRRAIVPSILAALVMFGSAPLILPSSRPFLPRDQYAVDTLEAEAYAELTAEAVPAYSSNLVEMRPIGAERRYYPPAEPGRIAVLEGAAQVESTSVKTSLRRYEIDAQTDALVRLETYHMPGWAAEWNGVPVEIESEPGSALQLVRVPAGRGTLSLSYGRRRLLPLVR